MKKIFLLIILLVLVKFSFSQCNVKSVERDDSVKVRYTRPDRIGYCDKFFLGLSMQTDGTNYYLVALCIFKENTQKLSNCLTLFFQNDKSFKIKYVNSETTTLQNEQAVANIFVLDSNVLNNITISNLKMVTVQLNDGIIQSVPIMFNSDKLMIDYNCLRTK